ncbi:MAG TPA: hypothetical protein DEG17_23430 [Cyanobacteria bacterium UBA11149]|nr:hypothetical protein [Cyanobacteria bacterium UBA11367]HBE57066.1 hypothetical protein [Cyanobacteria bacterium UBA11366]HBK63455.1 hypothetical protein [Cyanobacteria bacterium UBA11166]HBR72131.1 hypothetical protein [Cyanobacteria bacterium UBA11159]HBS72644.1 hypothetical protein [Cyanobacteria bacterium UBA11153]HBW91734.1 hypothetical protein [Cyanobacteria bacterium UBA11149]HCA97893.1 hypothetical protein [Cyanobacteria bacterium UBA9226]
MTSFTLSSRLISLATALALGWGGNIPAQAQSLGSKIPNQWEFSPPSGPTGNPLPENREGGGVRGDCIADNNPDTVPIALVPKSGVGTTIAQYPTLFWYMPKTKAWGVELIVRNANNKEVYSIKYPFAKYPQTRMENGKSITEEFVLGSPGIMSFTLPASSGLSGLETNQAYHWQLRVMCDETDRSGDFFIDGGFKRVEDSSGLASRVEQLPMEEQFAMYADKRLWYEALGTLIEMRREKPNDRNAIEAWNKLLKSAELDNAIGEPLFEEARSVNNR